MAMTSTSAAGLRTTVGKQNSCPFPKARCTQVPVLIGHCWRNFYDGVEGIVILI